MTIQREYRNGPFVIQCDTCLDAEELEGTERPEAVKDAKDRGYVLSFDGRQTTCKHCWDEVPQVAAA